MSIQEFTSKLKRLLEIAVDYIINIVLGSTNTYIYTPVDTQAETIDIPKKVHYIWLGSRVKDRHKNNIESFRQQNPDYEIHLWIDRDTLPLITRAEDLPAIKHYCHVNNIILHDIADPEHAEWANKHCYVDWLNGQDKIFSIASNYARLKIINLHGGVYLDTDVECIKPLGCLSNNLGFFGLKNATGQFQGPIGDSWFIASVANNEILRQISLELELHYKAFIIDARIPKHQGELGDFVHSAIFDDHQVAMRDKVKQRVLFDTAYNKFRFNRVATQGLKVKHVGGILFINQLNAKLLAQRTENTEAYVLDVRQFFIDQHDGSWYSWKMPQRRNGVRGLDINGIDTAITFDDTPTIAVTFEELREAFEAQPEHPRLKLAMQNIPSRLLIKNTI